MLPKFLNEKSDQGVSERTLKDYKRQSKYLIEYFKDRDINSISSKSEYAKYREWRKNYHKTHEKKNIQKYKRFGKTIEGRKYTSVGNVVLNRECRLLVNILRFCKDSMNLFENVQIASYKMLPESRREEILSKKEYDTLREYWLNKNPFYWQIISFVNNTGIRYPSELNRICNKDVHLDKSYVLIRDRKNKKKDNPLHTPVPIVGRAKEIIETLQARQNISNNPDDPVFVNDQGIQIKSISKAFKKSLDDCGIKRNLTMYSLRHLFTTRMVRRPDIPIKILSEVLGHKNTTMIDKHYAHLRAEDYVNVFQRSEDHKQEILKNRNNNTTPEQTETELTSSSQSSNE